MPISGYILQPLSTSNKNTTHCEVNGEVVSGISVEYRGGKVDFKGVTKQGTKCYLYFDIGTLSELTFEKLNLTKSGDLPSAISTTACDNGTNDESHNKSGSNCTSQDKGVYEAEDDFGKSYVFRGTVDNNWVKFAGYYWRIIRINGNGTIRMIYAGTTKPSEGKWGNIGDNAAIKTSTGTTSVFNDYYNDNKYVGYMFGTEESGSVGSEGTPTVSYEEAHQNNYDSTIKEEIDKWYEGSSGIQEQYRNKIDVEAGFCSDRQLSPETHSDSNGSWLGVSAPGAGYNKTQTAYAGYHRTHDVGTNYDSTQEPTLKCSNKIRDLFTGPDAQGTTDGEGNEIKGNNALTYPVGLITMDEVIMAGGLAGKVNYGYWLSTGQYYWTISPYAFYAGGSSPNALIFYVTSNGYLSFYDVIKKYGIRPVINLKADVTISGGGTIDSPYEIS